mgnify:CR=1 FL=1
MTVEVKDKIDDKCPHCSKPILIEYTCYINELAKHIEIRNRVRGIIE